MKKKLIQLIKAANINVDLIISKELKFDDCKIISSLSVCILEKTKKIDKLTMTGSKIGIICGKESSINFANI